MDELFELMTNDGGNGNDGMGRKTDNNDVVGPLFLDDDVDDDDYDKDGADGYKKALYVGASTNSAGVISGRVVLDHNRPSSSTSSNARRLTTSTQQQPQHKSDSRTSSSNGNFIGNLRILYNRQMSSVTLHEMMSQHLVLSPASLVAMPLARLNTLLESPAQIVDKATVSGTTISNFMTTALVFKNSGTKISSSKGSAFCVLSVGSNFSSGPCMSVFLFGDAYGQYMKQCQPGQILCLFNGPKLLPPSSSRSNSSSRTGSGSGNSSNDHAISFSISKKEQIRLVGTAQDFGYCKATNIRQKQPNGTWANNGTCSNWIDKRQPSPYCEHHKHLRNASNNGKPAARAIGASSCNLIASKFEQIRQQQTQAARLSVSQPVPTTGVIRRQIHQLSSKGPQMQQVNSMSKTNRFCQSVKTASSSSTVTTTNNRLLNTSSSSNNSSNSVSKRQSNLTTSKQMDIDRGHARVGANEGLRRMIQTTSEAPRDRRSSSCSFSHQPTASSHKSNSTEWLQQTIEGKKPTLQDSTSAIKKRPALSLSDAAKRCAAAAKKQKVIVHGDSAAFDGSVMVPTPSKTIFGPPSDSSSVANVTPSSASAEEKAEHRDRQHRDLLNRQAEIAMKLKSQQPVEDSENNNGCKNLKRHTNKNMTSITGKGSAGTRSSNEPSNTSTSSFLEAMGWDQVDEAELEKARDAKSLFFDEINAEQYAKSRERISELERLEEQKIKNKKTNDETYKPQLSKSWRCVTCGQSFKFRPKACIISNHDVTMRRDIIQGKTKTEQRLRVHNKDAGDGGLKLGSGLEWSDFRRGWSRFS